MREKQNCGRGIPAMSQSRIARDAKRRRDTLMLAVGIAAIAPFGTQSAQAVVTHTWVGTANWTSNASPGWNGTGVPGVAPGDIAQYATTATAAVTTLDISGVVIGQIKNTKTGAWTINRGSGTSITFDNSGGVGNAFDTNAYLGVDSNGDLNFNPDIVIANTDLTIGASSGNNVNVGVIGTGTITATSSRSLFLKTNGSGGNITINSTIGATGSAIAISDTAPLYGAITLAGAIGGAGGTGAAVTISNTSNAVAGTNGSLIISGVLGATVSSVTQNSSALNSMTLSGANTAFVGTIALQAGTLNLNNNNALGATGAGGTFTITGGSLSNTSAGTITLASTNAEAWNGDFSYTNTGTNNLNLGTGAVAMNASRTITSTGAGSLTVGGIIGGSGFGLTKTGASSGALILTGANTYSGLTAVTGGTLQVSGAAGAIASSSGLTISGNGVASTGANASGRFILDKTAGTAVDSLNDSVDINLSTGGEFQLNGTAVTSAENVGNIVIGAGHSTVTVTATTSGTMTLAANALTHTGGGTAFLRGSNFTNSNANAGRITVAAINVPAGADFIGTNTVNNAGSGDTTSAIKIVPWLVGSNSTSGNADRFVTYDATLGFRGMLQGEGTSLGAGSTTVSAAPVNATVASTSAALTSTADLTVNSLAFSSTGTLTGNGGALIVNSGAILFSANANTSVGGFSGITLGNGTANQGYVYVTNASGNTLTLNNAISVTGSGGLTKSGVGTLVLGASNLYSGATTVNQGTLQIGTGTAGDLGSNAANIVLNVGTTLSFGRTNAGLTISNTISGAGGVTQSGSGTTQLSGTNIYTGTTTVSNGTLVAGNTQALGTSAAPLQLNGGILDLATDSSITAYNTTVGGSATIQSDKATASSAGMTHTLGTLNIAGAFTLTTSAGANVNGGTAGVTFGATTIANTATLNVTTADLTLGAITTASSTSFVKTGGGTLVLNGSGLLGTSNALTTRGGIVREDVAGALDTTGGTKVALTVAGNVTNSTTAFNLNNVNQTISTLTFGSASGGAANAVNSVATGTGTLTLGGGVTYNKSTSDANDPGTATISGKVDLGGASRTFTIADSSNTSNELNVSAVISGAGFGITKAGAGTMTVSGTNSYTGTTTVSSGKLVLNGTHAIAGATNVGAYSVASAATLAGTGTTDAAVTISSGGHISPGTTGIGTLSTGNLTIGSGAIFDVDADTTSNTHVILNGGTFYQSDTISVTGTVVLGGTLVLSQSDPAFNTFSPGRTIVLILNDGTDTIGTTFANSTSTGALSYVVNYNVNADGGSVANDVTLTFTSVPEPTSLGLLLLGTGGLLARRRRGRC